MKLLQKIVGLCVLLAAATFGVNAHAADATSVDRTLKGDAVCTRCHDEGSTRPFSRFTRHAMGTRQTKDRLVASHATVAAQIT